MPSSIHIHDIVVLFPRRQRCHLCQILLIYLIIATIGCRSESAPPLKADVSTSIEALPSVNSVTKFAPRPNNYTGSQACAECHNDISNTYQGHPMAHSAAVINRTELDQISGSQFFPAAQGFFYRVEQSKSGLIHHEQKRDPSGAVLASRSQLISFSIGSGKRGKAYLWNSGGLLFQSPITWYAASDQWDLAPGYANQNRHFERRITAECVQCHVGRVNTINDDGSRFGSPPFLELGIGCESCHGPGESHIAVQRGLGANQSGTLLKDPIINPSKLAPQHREAVCNQCHLPTGHRILRYGRGCSDFRPGDSMHDIWVVMINSNNIDDNGATEAVSHVPQMHASRCYQASQGQLGCSSCHSPHRVPVATERTDYYRERCLQCHEKNGKPCSEVPDARRNSRDSCYECHMPRLGASNVPHTSQTDHRIIRRSTSSVASTKDVSELQVFGDETDKIPAAEVTRARGMLMSQFAHRDQDRLLAAAAVQALESVASWFPEDEPRLVALGFAYAVENRPQRAREIWEQVVRINPLSEDGWRGLGMVAHDAGEFDLALDAFQRVLTLNPHDRIAIGRSVHVLGLLRRFDEGIALARKAIEMFPADSQLHQWLGGAYRSVGRESDAEHHQRLFRAIDPKANRPPDLK